MNCTVADQVRFGDVRTSNVAALRRITPFPASASPSKSSCGVKASEKGENKRAQMAAKISIVTVIVGSEGVREPNHMTSICSTCNISEANVVACSAAAALPLFVLLLRSRCTQVSAIVLRQHRNYILFDKEIEGTAGPRTVRCLGLYLVYSSGHHLPLNVHLNPSPLSHLLVTRPSKSRALESFVIDTALRSTHVALIVCISCPVSLLLIID